MSVILAALIPFPANMRFAGGLPHRVITVVVLALGVFGSLVSFVTIRAMERERAAAEFARRASVRHTLTREVLGRYEDSLFGLAALFMLNANVTRAEFIRATARLEERLGGAQAFEWVPAVPQADRAAFEAALKVAYPDRGFEIREIDPQGLARRAAERAEYYPISYIQPLAGNEAVLGYDVKTAPTRPFLEQARATRQMVVTRQIELAQDRGGRGVVLIWPVYQPAPAGSPSAEVFRGFLQCVFRLPEFLEAICSQQPDATLELLFVDASETDPVRRILHQRPAAAGADAGPAREEAFRGGLALERGISFGGRDWRVLYRPRPGWLEKQYTWLPLLRAAGLMGLATLLAGLVQIVGRQTDTIHREVAERTRELAESRREYASLLQALPGMAYRCRYDDQLTVLFLSEGVRALTGWGPDDFRNGQLHFRDCVHPDDLQRVREVTKAGLQERAPIETEFRIRHRNGGDRWVLSRGHGVYYDDGRLEVFEGLAIDITAQKQAEAARLALERKLLEGQKLESLGLLAGGIAHDFNNLLSAILGNATLARMGLPPGSAVDGQLSAIEETALRAAELCRQMLAYAGKGRFVIEPTDVTRLTQELLPLLKVSIARQAILTLNLAEGIPAVLADATQLRQIVMNLVLNAAEAIGPGHPGGGEIRLNTGVVKADAAMLAGCVAGAALPAGDYVFIEVRDNGCGMTPEVMAKIFDPFFTTKFAGRGLGLAAVLGIVRGHQGALRVESMPGVGSTFRLLLPPASCPVPPRLPEANTNGRWTSTANVLLVEDEELVRAVLTDTLKTFGLTTRSASDGDEAVTIFRQNPAAVDVVVLDLLMPGMGGEQTLEVLRQLKPDVRVLLMSGYNQGDILGRLAGSGRLDFLAKPFTRKALEQKLRQLLS